MQKKPNEMNVPDTATLKNYVQYALSPEDPPLNGGQLGAYGIIVNEYELFEGDGDFPVSRFANHLARALFPETPMETVRKSTTRTWSLPHLYAAKAYLVAQYRGAGRAAGEQDELERMVAAIRYAIEGWVDAT